MADARVFISYDQQESIFARALARDLSASGIEAVPDSYAGATEQLVRQELPRYQWLLLVRSPRTLPSERVQAEVSAAMQYTALQRMQGVFAIVPTPSEQPVPPAWSAIRAFPFTEGDRQSYENALGAVRSAVGVEELPPAVVTVKPVGKVVPPRERSDILSPRSQRNARARGRATVRRTSGGREGFLLRTLPMIVVLVLVILLISLGVIAYQLVTADKGGQVLTGSPVVTVTAPTSPASPVPTVASDPQAIFKQLTHLRQMQGINFVKAGKWEANNSCVVQGDGSYRITSQTGVYQPCMLQGDISSNFAYQVQMKIIQGDAGGLIFRADQTLQNYYRFSIASDGSVSLIACAPCSSDFRSNEGTPVALHAANVQYKPNDTATLTVIASNASLAFFINDTFVAQVNDIQVKGTLLGLYAASTSASSTEVVFSNPKVWKL